MKGFATKLFSIKSTLVSEYLSDWVRLPKDKLLDLTREEQEVYEKIDIMRGLMAGRHTDSTTILLFNTLRTGL